MTTPSPLSASPLSATERTTHRRALRARYDRDELYAVLDAGMVCHLGLVTPHGPMVLPTSYGRIDDTLYLHGSTGARSLRTQGPVCVTVTHLDGLVLARSAMHHSVNYRSAVVYGEPRTVTDPDEHLAGLRAVVEQLVPGQWDSVRPPTRKELAATQVLALSLAEASVKVRTGPPVDDEEDYALPVWAGVAPLRVVFDPPVPDERLAPGTAVPAHVVALGGR